MDRQRLPYRRFPSSVTLARRQFKPGGDAVIPSSFGSWSPAKPLTGSTSATGVGGAITSATAVRLRVTINATDEFWNVSTLATTNHTLTVGTQIRMTASIEAIGQRHGQGDVEP